MLAFDTHRVVLHSCRQLAAFRRVCTGSALSVMALFSAIRVRTFISVFQTIGSKAASLSKAGTVLAGVT
jgi:hypothetical protein